MTRIGGFCAEHGAHLHRARMRAQELAFAIRVRLEKERVVHIARRMAGREVELGEIVVVALDVRPFGDGEAHLGENGGDLVHHLADRMDAAGLDAGQRNRQRDVERLALELGLKSGALEHRAPRGKRFRDLILQRIDRRAARFTLIRRELAERCEQRGDRSLLAERGDARSLERVFVARAVNRRERLPFKGGKVRHPHGLPAGRLPLPFTGTVPASPSLFRDPEQGRDCGRLRRPSAERPSPVRRSRRTPQAR